MEFKNLPEKIRNWITSEQITYLIVELERKFDIPEEKESLIPKIIFSIATGQVKPEALRSILLKELAFDPNRTAQILNEIKTKIFLPIEKDLSALGIDTQAIIRITTPKPEINLQRAQPVVSPDTLKPQQAPQKLREVPPFSAEQTPPPQKTLPKIPTVRPSQPPPVGPVESRLKTEDPTRGGSFNRVDLRGKKPIAPKPTDDQPFILHHENIPVALPKTLPATKQVPKTQNQKSAERVVHYSGPTTLVE